MEVDMCVVVEESVSRGGAVASSVALVDFAGCLKTASSSVSRREYSW